MRTRLTSFLLLLGTCPGFAQDRTRPVIPGFDPYDAYWPLHCESAQDSLDFAAYLTRCADTSSADVPTGDYRLAWSVHLRGGMMVLRRGDGQPFRDLTGRPQDLYPLGAGEPGPLGRRCATMVAEEPCGLVCRTVWYFEAP